MVSIGITIWPLGPLSAACFTELLTMPVGLSRISRVSRCVFRPNSNAYPDDYLQQSGTALVLRPEAFRNNARDVVDLFDYVTETSPRYGEIKVPTVILTGDGDEIVSADIHSTALSKQVSGSQLLRIKGLGHKPDFAATDLCIASLEDISGHDRDLKTMAIRLEEQLLEQTQPVQIATASDAAHAV